MAFDSRRSARRDQIAAGVLVVLSLALLALPAPQEAMVRGAILDTVLRPFLSGQSELAERRARLVDIATLRSERDSLLAVASAQNVMAEENARLRALLGVMERPGGHFAPANLVRIHEVGAAGTFFVTAGREHGVVEGSAIVTAGGLLGMIRGVGDGYAQGIDWTNPDFRVGAMTDGGETYGIIEPRAGRFREEDMLALVGAPFHSDIPAGTRIVTSGRGGVVPRGIPVGTVVGIEEADTGWRKSYILRPSVRPEAARQVLVAAAPGERAPDLSSVWNVAAPPEAEEPSEPPPGGGG